MFKLFRVSFIYDCCTQYKHISFCKKKLQNFCRFVSTYFLDFHGLRMLLQNSLRRRREYYQYRGSFLCSFFNYRPGQVKSEKKREKKYLIKYLSMTNNLESDPVFTRLSHLVHKKKDTRQRKAANLLIYCSYYYFFLLS